MKSCSVIPVLVLIALLAAVSCEEYYDDEIDPDQIVFKISNTSQGITVTWTTPDNDTDPMCYRTEVQYKSQCVKDWKRGQKIELAQKNEVYHLTLSTLSMKINYDFRIRMKLSCVDKDWSEWTKVQSWGSNTGACGVKSPSYMWVYILIIVLILAVFLLVCFLTQRGIRRLILPDIPDPKHFKTKITDNDNSQWWGNLTQRNEECTTTDIEIIGERESEEQHQTLVEPISTCSEQHDSMYCIYSSETYYENTELQNSQKVLGYITL